MALTFASIITHQNHLNDKKHLLFYKSNLIKPNNKTNSTKKFNIFFQELNNLSSCFSFPSWLNYFFYNVLNIFYIDIDLPAYKEYISIFHTVLMKILHIKQNPNRMEA